MLTDLGSALRMTAPLTPYDEGQHKVLSRRLQASQSDPVSSCDELTIAILSKSYIS